MKKLLKKVIGTENVEQVKNYFYEKMPFSGKFSSRRLFYSNFLKAGDIFFDVGANLGNRVEPVLAIGGIKVVAIEPQEQCYNYLKKKFGNKITIINKGLSSQVGIQNMYIGDVSTVSSFSKKFVDESQKSKRFGDVEWNTEQSIEMTTLDILIETLGVPKFIKIDVEGYEFEVLKGLTKPVEYISFEYNVPEMLGNAINCIEYVASIMPIKCNYSEGDTMILALKEWISVEEMISLVNKKQFLDSIYGDIYISCCA